MYCDIDILILKPLSSLTETIPDNTICVHHEGTIHDTNYGATYTKEELSVLDKIYPGFSAGKFLLGGHQLYIEFMELMNTNIERYSSEISSYYCVDQPLFNKAVNSLDLTQYTIDMDLLDRSTISTNTTNYTSTTVLLDYMGEPGNGTLHLNKIIEMYIFYQMQFTHMGS